jgi:hypothetical protein
MGQDAGLTDYSGRVWRGDIEDQQPLANAHIRMRALHSDSRDGPAKLANEFDTLRTRSDHGL